MKYIYYIGEQRVESLTKEQKQKYTDVLAESLGLKKVKENKNNGKHNN